MATLLALIFRAEPDFCEMVLGKLHAALVRALGEDEVLSAKLALRALAVLAEGGVRADPHACLVHFHFLPVSHLSHP